MVIIYLIIIILIFLGGFKLFKTFYLVKYCKSKVCLLEKTVIVTGGNAGIGYATALDLACRGARVILACRNEQRGNEAVEKIKKETHNKNVVLKILDLASIKSIKNFAKDITENEKRVDILINNAGILGSGEAVTEDGLQLAWQSNHFGPVLLTLLLLDVLKKSTPSRIVNVSSGLAKISNLSLKTLNLYVGHWGTYSDTKLANILFTQELAKKLANTNVSVFSLHPGAVATDIVPDKIVYAVLKPLLKFVLAVFYLVPEEGAQTSIYCACQDGIEEQSGNHFERCQVVGPYKKAQNPALAKAIWDETLRLLKYEKME